MCESQDGVAEEWLCSSHVAGQLTTHTEAHVCLGMNTEALPCPGEARSLVGTNPISPQVLMEAWGFLSPPSTGAGCIRPSNGLELAPQQRGIPQCVEPSLSLSGVQTENHIDHPNLKWLMLSLLIGSISPRPRFSPVMCLCVLVCELCTMGDYHS